MSYETRYAAKKQAEFDRRANSPEAVAWRLRDAEIRDLVKTEVSAKYPEITADNFEEANAYRERRIQDLHAMYERWAI